MKKSICVICLTFIIVLAIAQRTIKGKIIDGRDGFPIAGASVNLKGTTIITTTAADGSFVLVIADSLQKRVKTDILVISFVGFQTQEIFLGNINSETLSVMLNENINSLSEVVVIGYGTIAKEKQIVTFPWPPPESSATSLLTKDYFRGAQTLKKVNSVLWNALDNCGYNEKSYYYVPNGFALVTRIEQISQDGAALDEPERWSIETVVGNLSWKNYIKSLFFSNTGYFRIIVFIITNEPFNSSDQSITREAAIKWLRKGLNTLPKEIGMMDFTEDYNCTALIYEFKKPESDDAFLVLPSDISGQDHLKKTKIIDKLKRK